MADIYESVGAVDRAVAGSVSFDDDSILVDDGGDELLIARPKGGDADE